MWRPSLGQVDAEEAKIQLDQRKATIDRTLNAGRLLLICHESFGKIIPIWVVATQIFFIFNPKIAEDEPILTHIFQMGWNPPTNQIGENILTLPFFFWYQLGNPGKSDEY